MKRLIAAAALAWIAPIAHATTYSTDASDLWFNSHEPGWGVNVMQQDNVLFLTLFVYGANNQPAWYVGPAITATSSSAVTYAGDLYQTNGPWFGGPFDPNAVGNRKVGIATFTLNTVGTGTLTYSVDGVSVTKQIERQTWRFNDLSGSYYGTVVGAGAGCGAGTDGHAEFATSFAITQSGSTFSMVDAGNCTYSGTYTQSGRMGTISASGSCGTFDGVEVEGNPTGLTMRLQVKSGNNNSCVLQGKLAATRR
jgi:hypothetical protein